MDVTWLLCVPPTAALALQAAQTEALRRVRRRPAPVQVGFAPPVSILKPLKGLDDDLFDNLESFCRLDYPDYEVIISLQDRHDPAYRVAAAVRARHPERVKLVVEHSVVGRNPKINTIMPALHLARHEFLLISDSNVAADPGYLRETVAAMADPSVGLVTNLIRGEGARSPGSLLENLHLNGFIAGSMALLFAAGLPCVVGKSMLLRRRHLEAVGGLAAFKDVLAEDYLIGRSLQRRGIKVVLAGHAVVNRNRYWGLDRFLNRHTRWAKLRWKIGGARYLSELVANPVLLALLAAAAAGFGRVPLAVLGTVSLAKAGLDLLTARLLGSRDPALHWLAVPLKDLLVGGLWVAPFLDDTAAWRGARYRLGPDTILLPLEPEMTDQDCSLSQRQA
jgi:ceramide glucosyltransferase